MFYLFIYFFNKLSSNIAKSIIFFSKMSLIDHYYYYHCLLVIDTNKCISYRY